MIVSRIATRIAVAVCWREFLRSEVEFASELDSASLVDLL
jgi:hypothetical protein